MSAVKSNHSSLGVGAAVLLSLMLGGCNGAIMEMVAAPLAVELHEPGKYVGKSDPLLDQTGTPEHQSRIAERFEMAATDR
jgi:hypothetical protein